MEKKIMNTWQPIKCTSNNNKIDIDIWGRHYTIENNVLFSSVIVLGEEILFAPIRISAKENNNDCRWTEIENFVLESEDEKAIICSSMRSEYIAVNAVSTIEFDGYTSINLTVMPRTHTIYEDNHYGEQEPSDWALDKLWIEIPLKKSCAKNFHYYPNDVAEESPVFEGEGIPFNRVASSREIPCSMHMPFKPLIFLGNEKNGFCFAADHNKNWQNDDKKKAIEIIDGEKEVVLRLRLLDHVPKSWYHADGSPLKQLAQPISFEFSFQVTPVKEFPANPYKEKIMHIDCFNGKILEEYNEFLKKEYIQGSGENCYDRMKRLGVTTLILHEKWNPIQNYWKISADTQRRTDEIVCECKKRGIKVIPYFGYEISTLSPDYVNFSDQSGFMDRPGLVRDFTWYRKPNQRCRRMCCNGDFTKHWVEGIKNVIERFDFDGVYVDSYFLPLGCLNGEHGCGFVDADGELCKTYPVNATRELAREIYDFLEKRGGIFNPHISSCCNIPAFSFCHLNWDGEAVQWHIARQGDLSIDALTPDYMRTEYIGRNFGLSYELIAYTLDNWCFEDSMTISLVHGVLPRPNVMGEPLELMSAIWKAIDDFGVEGAEFKPYWTNNIDCGNEKTKITYYEKNGKRLAFISNMSNNDNENINFKLGDTQTIIDAITGEELTMPITIKARKHKVLFIND